MRWRIQERIRRLDPETQAPEIMHYVGGWEFPWDMTRALELAL